MHGEPQTLEYKRIKNFWAEYKFKNNFKTNKSELNGEMI